MIIRTSSHFSVVRSLIEKSGAFDWTLSNLVDKGLTHRLLDSYFILTVHPDAISVQNRLIKILQPISNFSTSVLVQPYYQCPDCEGFQLKPKTLPAISYIYPKSFHQYLELRLSVLYVDDLKHICRCKN